MVIEVVVVVVVVVVFPVVKRLDSKTGRSLHLVPTLRSVSIYRVIHKSLRDFRIRLRDNQDRHGRKEHINR